MDTLKLDVVNAAREVPQHACNATSVNRKVVRKISQYLSQIKDLRSAFPQGCKLESTSFAEFGKESKVDKR